MKNLIKKILREDDWDFLNDSTPSPDETMNTVLGYEKEGDEYKVSFEKTNKGFSLWFFKDEEHGYTPITYVALPKEEFEIDELLDFVIEKMEFTIHNNKIIAKDSMLGPKTIGVLNIRKKEELLDKIKNARTTTIKEETDSDWGSFIDHDEATTIKDFIIREIPEFLKEYNDHTIFMELISGEMIHIFTQDFGGEDYDMLTVEFFSEWSEFRHTYSMEEYTLDEYLDNVGSDMSYFTDVKRINNKYIDKLEEVVPIKRGYYFKNTY